MDKSEYLFLKDKSEYFHTRQKVFSYPLGNLLFSFMEIDWDSYLDDAQNLLDRLHLLSGSNKATIKEGLANPEETIYCIVHDYYNSLKSQFKDTGSCLGFLFPSMVLKETYFKYEQDFDEVKIDKNLHEVQEVLKHGGDTRKVFEKEQDMERPKGNMLIVVNLFNRYLENELDCDFFGGFIDIDGRQLSEVAIRFMNLLAHTLKDLCTLQANLEEMIEYIETPVESYEKIKPSQQLCLMQATGFKPYKDCSKLYDEISYKRLILDSKSLHVISSAKNRNEFLEQLKNNQLAIEIFISSKSICALIFFEFDYLCLHNFSIRTCESCGSYFLPFSSASLYCERIVDVEANKTCKDVGAMRKYNQNVSSNAAKALFRRLANAYQMRCKRAPSCYPRAEYEAWKAMASYSLEQVESGLLEFEEFDRKIKLPDKK